MMIIMVSRGFTSFVVGSFLLMDLIQGGTTFTTTTTATSFQQKIHHDHQKINPHKTFFKMPPPLSPKKRTSSSAATTTTTTNLINDIRGGADAAAAGGGATITMNWMTFSESLLPNLRRLFAGSAESYSRGWNSVLEKQHRGDCVILMLWSLLPVPLLKVIHKLYYQLAMKIVPTKEYKEYEKSKLYKSAVFVSQGGRIASIVYAIEMLTTFCVSVMARAAAASTVKPVKPPLLVPKSLIPLQKFPGLVGNCLYGYWLAANLVTFKARILRPVYTSIPDSDTVDRLLNYMIYIIATILILEVSQFDFTALVKSLVAVGGLSSVVVGLALREPVSQLLQGILMMASNKYRKNEEIRLADGTQGKVVDIGLLETTIQGGDNIQVRIPHSKLAGQKFSNLSRMTRSQTKFELRFHLYDMPRVHEIISAIRKEIIDACPKLIKDGSQPFRVYWTDVGNDHFVIMIDARHNVRPIGDEYFETRQQVLIAISKATRKVHAKLAIPMQLEAKISYQE